MRFAIWSGAVSGISMPTSMEKSRHVLNVRNGWRPALARLPEILDWNNKGAGNQITKLEINCHGTNGALLLPDQSRRGLVDHTCVGEFALLLKPHMVRGALIELLACSVAGIDVSSQADDLGPSDRSRAAGNYSQSVLDEYWGAYDRAPISLYAEGRAVLKTGEDADIIRKRMAMRRQWEWDAEGNGLRFCLSLAARTGCTVRASDVRQYETDKAEPKMAVDAIGNWEGHVWDFFPDGKVKYLGMDVRRSQGHIALETGDRYMAHAGLRATGADTEDSLLRGRRQDRVPMPA